MSENLTAAPAAATASQPDHHSFKVKDYLLQPREAETWLLKPLIPASGLALLYGDPKVGKSYAALQLAMALNGGAADWFDFPVVTAGNVLYVQLDTSRSLWMSRLETLRENGHPVDDLDMADRESLGTWPFDILKPAHFKLLRAEVDRLRPVAVIMDTLRESHTADENLSDRMQVVIASLEAAVKPAALILIAHARKPSVGPEGQAAPDLMNDNRGSGYVVGRMDGIIRFSRSGMYYAGRATEPGNIKLKRTPDGLWVPDNDRFKEHMAAVLSDTSFNSLRERARKLSEISGKTESACLAALSRAVQR